MVVNTRGRKQWGWGFEDEQPSPEEVRAAAPRGAKAAVDPRGVMNPGVLIDPLQ